MSGREWLMNAMTDAALRSGATPTILEALVEAEEATQGNIVDLAEEWFRRPDAAITAVDTATQCSRVAKTAWERWDVNADRIDQPSTLASLVNLLNHARNEGLKLRIVGSARSLSNASEPPKDGHLVATCRYGEQLAVDAGTLKDGVDAAGLYRAEAGRVLADVLLDLDATKRSLDDMGSGCFQSLAGALSTSTHGSGVSHPGFPGLVRSLDVVTYDDHGNAVVRRIEPKDGVTDPAKFALWSAARDRGQMLPLRMELVQDDDVFNAWTVSLGCLGAIYSVTIAAVPTYWLRETRTVEWWSDVQAAMARDLNTVEYYELLVSTWVTDNQGKPDRQCLVTRRVRVTDPKEQQRSGGRPVAMAIAQTEVGRLATEVTTLWAMRDPLVRVAVPQKTGITASQVPADAPYTDTSYEVLLLRMNLNATSSELGIPLAFDDAGQVDPTNAVRAATTILAMADANQAAMVARIGSVRWPYQNDFDGLLAAWRESALHMSPIAIRFVAKESALLAMQYGAPTCMIEMPMPGSDLFDRELVDPPRRPTSTGKLYAAYDEGRRRLFADVEQRLMKELGARPHWGQVNTLTWSSVLDVLPAAPRWKAIYDKANFKGVFDGPLTDQLEISAGPPRAPARETAATPADRAEAPPESPSET